MTPTPQRTEKAFAVHGTYGHSPKFIQIRDDLRNSAAFLSLTGTDKDILIDFINHYNAATNFDRDESKITKPILYTFGMCAALISKNTFYRSMKNLQTHGFVVDYAGSDYRRGKASRWIACTRWRSWRPDQAQLRELNLYKSRRSSSCENLDQLKFPFVTYLREASNPTTEPAHGITHLKQHTDAVLEELWNKNASHHQAQLSAKS